MNETYERMLGRLFIVIHNSRTAIKDDISFIQKSFALAEEIDGLLREGRPAIGVATIALFIVLNGLYEDILPNT